MLSKQENMVYLVENKEQKVCTDDTTQLILNFVSHYLHTLLTHVW